MTSKPVRALIVGASSPLGKELAELINTSPAATWDLALADDGEGGQLSAAGEEAVVITAISLATFDGADLVFFTGAREQTRKHWKAALAAGASVVDLSGALEGEPGVVLAAAGFGTPTIDLTCTAVTMAHPAAVMIASVLRRLESQTLEGTVAVTLLLAASQWGEAGLDELHRQTVSLLSFQPVGKEFFDTQAAFAVRTEFGPEAKANVVGESTTLRRHLRALTNVSCSLQAFAVPVFHGLLAAMFIPGQNSVDGVAKALSGAGIQVVNGSDDTEISNLRSTGQADVLVSVRQDDGEPGIWASLAADNLQLAAANALASAAHLLSLRPGSLLQ